MSGHKVLGANVKVKLHLSSYVTKAYLKMEQVVIHQILLKTTDLANLKSDVDKFDIDKLEKCNN